MTSACDQALPAVTRCATAGVSPGSSGSYSASPPVQVGDSSAKYRRPGNVMAREGYAADLRRMVDMVKTGRTTLTP